MYLSDCLHPSAEFICIPHTGFPDGSVVKNPPANAGDIEMWVRSLGQEDPLEEGMATTPVFLPGETLFLPGKSHGHRSLAGYSPWGRKESDMTE